MDVCPKIICDQAFRIPLENIPRFNAVVFSECEIILLPLLSASTVKLTVYTALQSTVYTALPSTTFSDTRGADT